MDKEQEKAAKARDAALSGALTQIERTFGKGSIMRMGDEDAAVAVQAIPTGALSLDLALGVGGMPRGRIVEIFGPESSGKTTLLYHLLSEAQKVGGICAFIDAEHAMDPAYAKRIGVDVDELLVSQPDHGEQALEIRRIETLKDGTEAVGNRVRVKVVKNEVAAPFRQAEFDIEYGQGISSAGCLLDLGLEHNLVQKSGSFFSYGEERIGQGRGNAKAYLRDNPATAKELEGKIYAALGVEPARPAIAAVPASEDGAAPDAGAAAEAGRAGAG